MAIKVIEPGRSVSVSPGGGAEMSDVLEYAELAILGYGFRQGAHTVTEHELWEKPGKYGLSLHDAVGYAFVRLTGTEAAPQSGGKDKALYRDEDASFTRHTVYAAIHEAIDREMPGASDDWKEALAADKAGDGGNVFENWFNNVTDQDSVIRVLRIAREEVVA